MSGEKGTRAIDPIGSLLAAAGAALVVGFFLPWADLGGWGSISGLDLARESGWANHLLALAPLAGAGLVAYGLTDRQRARSLGVLTGVVVLGWTTYQAGKDIAEGLRWGGWIAVAGAAGLVASGASKQKGLAPVAGAIAAIAFFLPWYSDASGFEIARAGGVGEIGLRLAPVWLALGGAVLGAIGGLGEHRGPRIAALSGLLVIAGVMWPYVAVVNLVFGLGAWLTLGGAVTALGVGLATRRG